MIKITTEINETTQNQSRKSIKIKVGSFDWINKIDDNVTGQRIRHKSPKPGERKGYQNPGSH